MTPYHLLLCWFCLNLSLVQPAVINASAKATEHCPTCGQVLPQGATISNTDKVRSDSDAKTPPNLNNPASPATEDAKPHFPFALILGIVAPFAVLVAGVAYYFLLWIPRKKRRPLYEAYGILERDDQYEFTRAEQLLNQALITGLKAEDISDARFALAYVRTRLGRFAEASVVMQELAASGKLCGEAVYLDLWLQSHQKNHLRVMEIHQEHSELLNDILDTKLIVGIALLRQAKLLWARKEIDDALHYFDQLRRMGVLTEEIPQQIEDQRVIFGIIALFDNDFSTARQHFDSAR
jgi:tetratricopeptide (TPR) repeat protein